MSHPERYPSSCGGWIRLHSYMMESLGMPEHSADRAWAARWNQALSVAGGGTGEAPGAGLVFDAAPVHCRHSDPEFLRFVLASEVRSAAVFPDTLSGSIGALFSGATSAARTTAESARGAGLIFARSPRAVMGLALLAILSVKFAPAIAGQVDGARRYRRTR